MVKQKWLGHAENSVDIWFCGLARSRQDQDCKSNYINTFIIHNSRMILFYHPWKSDYHPMGSPFHHCLCHMWLAILLNGCHTGGMGEKFRSLDNPHRGHDNYVLFSFRTTFRPNRKENLCTVFFKQNRKVKKINMIVLIGLWTLKVIC